MKVFRWLLPGLRIKRYIFQLIGGIILLIMGIMLCSMKEQVDPGSAKLVVYSGSVFIIMGIYFVFRGVRRMLRSMTSLFLPQKEKTLVDFIYRKRKLAGGPKIVTVGGGTGLSTLLRGLKEYSSNITAVVTVADSGGSSGRLRDELDALPPGDIRSCLVALADAEPLMSKLFQYRFTQGTGLVGHNFGNLFITALSKVTGDFEKAIKESSKILAIRGEVVPSTLEKVTLVAKYQDGTSTRHEDKIPKQKKVIKSLSLDPIDASPTDEAVNAITSADLIVLGPGSLYTSVIPNLLIKGIREAIINSPAAKIYICNVMTEAGETDGYSAYDHLEAIVRHTDSRIANGCLVNTAKVPSELLAKYKAKGADPIEPDIDKIKEKGYMVIEDEIISTADFVRHDSEKLAKVLMNFWNKNKKLRRGFKKHL